MKIWSLMDDVSAGEGWEKEHGLSLYLETKRHRILFDTGKSGLFLKNAERAGIDISAVDTAVLSHGHYDHGGGLADFLERSRTAPVYIQEGALEPHYSRRAGGRIEEIGVDPALKKNPRLVTVRGALKIDEELTVFGRVPGEELLSEANRLLLERDGDGFCQDAFNHEQSLIVREKGGKRILVAGCAHRGIVNIIERFIQMEGAAPDAVIGGFHLMAPASGSVVPREQIEAVARRLLGFRGEAGDTVYYTCHCTGLFAYGILKERMGERISYLAAGKRAEL